MRPFTKSCSFKLLIAAVLVIPATQAETVLYRSGGGKWDATTKSWSPVSGGPYDAAWVDGGKAVFEGTPGTVTLGGDVSLKALEFTAASSGFRIEGHTLKFGPGGTITNAVPNVDHTITSAITGKPAVRIADNSGGIYLGLTFAPTEGSMALGGVMLPYESGKGDKGGITFAGSTTGNTIGEVDFEGGNRYADFRKEGPGTWTVEGGTRIGTIKLAEGTLALHGPVECVYSGFQFTGGTLAGTGPIKNDLVVPAGGKLAPGAPTGPLGIVGTLDLSALAAGEGTIELQLDAAGRPSDRIEVTGTVDIGDGALGFSDFTFTDLGGVEAGAYVLVSATGGITGTLDPDDRLGTIGGLNGALQINGKRLEWATDADGDGIPDPFELAHTRPASATALKPGDDPDDDGLDNLGEYLHGTDPNNPDSDGDQLEDGAEVAGAGGRPATDPTLADTDADGLSDRAETHTGKWIDSSNTGTNPAVVDSDGDGLSDTVETNTGKFVDATNTGTDPNLSNSDGDRAGDWYEVAASFTDPTDPQDQPGIPLPLPDPDPADQGATGKPVKVYILSGQSNMVGFGRVYGEGPGTLETVTKVQNRFPNMLDEASGGWTVRNDVFYRGVVSDIGAGPLKPDVAGDSFGPELGFGHVMGYHHDAPVLLIKSCIGNRSLSWDFLPPGSGSFDRTEDGETFTYAGYGQSPNRWPADGGASPFVWYAGKQYDDCFLDGADMGAPAWAADLSYPKGSQVRHGGVVYLATAEHRSSKTNEPGSGADWKKNWEVYSVFNVTDILDHFATEYPQWADQGFEIAGFVWWQGHKDGGEQGSGEAGAAALRYEQNLVNLIESLRNYYEDRYPGNTVKDAPFTVATVGFGGGGWDPGSSADVIFKAQLAVSDPERHPDLAGTVGSVDTTGYWRDESVSPKGQGFHYNHNAETYLLTGDALGRAMIELEK
ncbi:hypothetical protein [Haloferula sp. A504]|uniref:hypothetical protein n=1 Tax=Haloferula sp. A504 TaxID=3373601 RepID=UPI0031C40A2A|nr:hypothetical protein [Verrucomicrobiaceae bacterium E54]